MVDRKNIEAIYPLTPMQEAMLIQGIHSDAVDPGFLQLTCSLTGVLNEKLLREAWGRVVHRHTALRTSLHWKDLEKPMQVVHRRVDLPWRSEDLRATSDQDGARQALIEEDGRERFDLTRPPILRVALCRTAPDEWFVLWSCHHALLDGWSGALVLNEVLNVYEALRRNESIDASPARSYGEFVSWLQRQDLSKAESHWRRVLDGFKRPTPLPFARSGTGASRSEHAVRQSIHLSVDTTAALQRRIREYRVTWNTLFQGIWALALSRHSGEHDVLFGITDSGRASDLPGVDSMVGLFINTLPVRVRVAPEWTLSAFLQDLQRDQLDGRPHAFASPAQVQAWSAVPVRERLYESLLVVQNYPQRPATLGPPDGISMTDVQSGMTSNYPLTLVVVPGDTLQLHLLYDPARLPAEAMARLLDFVRSRLEEVAADRGQTLAALASQVGDGPRLTAPASKPVPGAAPRPSMPVPYVAPALVLETQLAEVWARTLNIESVGIDDDFFDLGGHSLMVAHLLDQIERTCGRRLPMATLIQTTTVRQLAALLRDEGWKPPWSSLVPMQPDGDRPPLFCIHSWTGDVLHFRSLARLMAPDYPVYGLQAAGLGSDEPVHSSVEEMASHYVCEIRSLFPRGPYALAGLCFGMKVAVEMAQQLVDQGETVAALFVLDTGVTLTGPPSTRLGYYLVRTREEIQETGLLSFIRNVVAPRFENWTTKRGSRANASPEARSARFVDATRLAWRQYELRPYPGHITFIRSRGWAKERKRDWQLPMWRRIADGGLSTCVVPGRHAQILKKPHVDELAAVLKDRLDTYVHAQTRPPALEPQAKTEEQVA